MCVCVLACGQFIGHNNAKMLDEVIQSNVEFKVRKNFTKSTLLITVTMRLGTISNSHSEVEILRLVLGVTK